MDKCGFEQPWSTQKFGRVERGERRRRERRENWSRLLKTSSSSSLSSGDVRNWFWAIFLTCAGRGEEREEEEKEGGREKFHISHRPRSHICAEKKRHLKNNALKTFPVRWFFFFTFYGPIFWTGKFRGAGKGLRALPLYTHDYPSNFFLPKWSCNSSCCSWRRRRRKKFRNMLSEGWVDQYFFFFSLQKFG